MTNAEIAQGTVGTVPLQMSTELPPSTWTPYSATFTSPHTIDVPPSLEFNVGATPTGPSEGLEFFVGFDDVSIVATAPPAPPAGTGGSTPAPVDYTCTAAPFPDVATSSTFCADVNYLTQTKIATGYPDGDFRPRTLVARQEMTAFLYRYEHPGVTAPVCTTEPFSDVATSNVFCGDIAALKAEGVIAGNGDGTFSPATAVSRQTMAAFLYRIANPGKTAAACTSKPFTDVATSNVFCGDITYLVTQKVTSGYPDGGFHPTTVVARQEMAAFLHRLYTATH